MYDLRRQGLAAAVVCMCLTCPLFTQAEDKPATEKKSKEKPDQATLEKEFQEKLSGCVLTGHYAMLGGNAGDKPPREEKYTLTKVSKLENGMWLFESRIQYGKNDVTLPLPLKVVWAGDTPVITLTDLVIPGLGTFTARVMIYGDRYAGTWQHDKVGGHLWGTIEKAPETDKDPAKPTAKPEAEK